MMLLGTQKINNKGHLEIGGCDTVDLAKEFAQYAQNLAPDNKYVKEQIENL